MLVGENENGKRFIRYPFSLSVFNPLVFFKPANDLDKC